MGRILLLFTLALAIFGLAARPAWATPPPDTVLVEPYATGRNLITAMTFAPAPDGRLFYAERGAGVPNSPRVMTLAGEPDALVEKVWLQLSGVDSRGERGILGVALDPDFATNGYAYIFYTNAASPRANRVVRYTERRTGPDAGTADPGSAFILMEIPISDTVDAVSKNHNGGNVHFGLDGYLYVTLGEFSIYKQWSQDLTVPFDPGGGRPIENSAAPGKIHRLDVRAPYDSEPNAARAPATNPFYDDGNPAVANDDRIWSYGHRHSFDFTFDQYVPPGGTASGFLFATENGPDCNDEILRVVKGYNYRWPLDDNCASGNPPQDATGPNPGDPAIPTLAYYATPIAPVGIAVYTGNVPEWEGDLFFCAFKTERLYHAELNAARTALTAPPEPVELPDGVTCGFDVENGSDGALYFANRTTIFRARLRDPLEVPTALTSGPLQIEPSTSLGAAFALLAVTGAIAGWRLTRKNRN
jgi:glucose/arabinose dehydrogenase